MEPQAMARDPEKSEEMPGWECERAGGGEDRAENPPPASAGAQKGGAQAPLRAAVKLPADASSLLPHRPPMLMLNVLIRCGNGVAAALAEFPLGHFGVKDGAVSEAAMVECVAQTAASMAAFDSAGSGRGDVIGMLAGISGFDIFSRPPAGSILEIEARLERRLGPLMLVSGRIFCGGSVVASGEIKVYDPASAAS